MAKPVLRIVSPDTVKRKVTPRRPKNAEVRTREYLTEREVERLIDGCKGQPATATGPNHDPDGLPARAAGFRGL
jgi:hypothetical protein